MKYTADFETTTDPADCRVWVYGICQINDPAYFLTGTDLSAFMGWAEKAGNPEVYFHNLKFDGEFILYWLFTHGFTHIRDSRAAADKTFTSLISDKGQFYTMTVWFRRSSKRSVKVTFYDSLKILPFSVAAIAKGFNLPVQKGSIDYDAPRPEGYKPTAAEISYLRNDCEIMARALKILFDENLTAMTQGSNALKDYKTLCKWKFEKLFPVPDYDGDIRQSYKGGFTYLSPRFAGKTIGRGIVLDVNSLYPAVMRFEMLPYGEGIYFNGRYRPDPVFSLHIQMLRCQFELKPGYIPTIQLKNNLAFIPTEYVTSSAGEDVTLCLTSVDLTLFLEHYNVYNMEYLSGWKFKAAQGLFSDYIDKWVERKSQAKEEGNKALYTLSKLMLNALYGKFALNPNVRSKYPVLENNVIRYVTGPTETRDPIYIPVGTFITSYARNKTIRAAQRHFKRFIYADTDSLHLIGTQLPEDMDIDPLRLGAWKHETTFTRARFLRAKTYMEYGAEPGSDKRKWKITCAGMPETCYPQVKFKNFKTGSRYSGKLVPKHVPGGIVLVNTEFTIR